jgi:dTDP-4-dehydrorhamnose reductase
MPDATDDYGWSKRLGETALLSRNNTVIFRVSIIGPECGGNPKGLLGWFLSQPPGSKLRGYINHLWNGITTLEWCRQAEDYLIRHDEGSPCRIVQLGTAEAHTKYEILRMFQEVYGTDFEISEFATEESVDKRLVPDIVSKPLVEQLLDLVVELKPS